jgi:hypothetical protein
MLFATTLQVHGLRHRQQVRSANRFESFAAPPICETSFSVGGTRHQLQFEVANLGINLYVDRFIPGSFSQADLT